MRLGVLLDRFDPAPGGAEAHTDALLRRAVERRRGAALAWLEGEAPAGRGPVRVEAPRAAGPRATARSPRRGERRLRGAGCDVVLAIRHATECDVYLPHGGLVERRVGGARRSRGGAGLVDAARARASRASTASSSRPSARCSAARTGRG